MSTHTIHPATAAVLDAVANDWRPTRVEARRILRDAVILTAQRNDDRVHIADIRPQLPEWIDPHQIGAYISSLARTGVLVPTGEYRANGGRKARNESKPARVYRLARPVPEVTP